MAPLVLWRDALLRSRGSHATGVTGLSYGADIFAIADQDCRCS